MANESGVAKRSERGAAGGRAAGAAGWRPAGGGAWRQDGVAVERGAITPKVELRRGSNN